MNLDVQRNKQESIKYNIISPYKNKYVHWSPHYTLMIQHFRSLLVYNVHTLYTYIKWSSMQVLTTAIRPSIGMILFSNKIKAIKPDCIIETIFFFQYIFTMPRMHLCFVQFDFVYISLCCYFFPFSTHIWLDVI